MAVHWGDSSDDEDAGVDWYVVFSGFGFGVWIIIIISQLPSLSGTRLRRARERSRVAAVVAAR